MAKEPSQPSYTCPEINSAIKDVKGIIKNLKDADYRVDTECADSVAKFISVVHECRRDLEGMEDDLEKLRSDNESLREHGNYWEREAGLLRDQIEDLEKQLQTTY